MQERGTLASCRVNVGPRHKFWFHRRECNIAPLTVFTAATTTTIIKTSRQEWQTR